MRNDFTQNMMTRNKTSSDIDHVDNISQVQSLAAYTSKSLKKIGFEIKC